MTDNNRSPIQRLESRGERRGAAMISENVRHRLVRRCRRHLIASLAAVAAVVVGIGVLLADSPNSQTVVAPAIPASPSSVTAPEPIGVGDVVVVPDTEGRTLTGAIDQLRAAGFRIDEEPIWEPSDDVERGWVVRTEPPAESLVPAGTAVRVIVSIGSTVSVPDVVGAFFDTAEATLENAGLTAIVEFRTVPFGDPTTGLVIAQRPGLGAVLEAGSEIVLVVGEAGPAPTTTEPT